MDGRMDRVGCEEGEEQCDVCKKQEVDRTDRTDRMDIMTSNIRFDDSGIGMSSQMQESMPSTTPNIPSSPVSEDQGFMEQSPIPGRFQTSQTSQTSQDDIETMFEQQQRERQWLASSITKQNRQEGQEIGELEEALRKWVNRCLLCKV
jgi:hypothetical protein